RTLIHPFHRDDALDVAHLLGDRHMRLPRHGRVDNAALHRRAQILDLHVDDLEIAFLQSLLLAEHAEPILSPTPAHTPATPALHTLMLPVGRIPTAHARLPPRRHPDWPRRCRMSPAAGRPPCQAVPSRHWRHPPARPGTLSVNPPRNCRC